MENTLLWYYVECFYKSYKVLCQKSMFRPGHESNVDRISYFIPAIVLGSFASELALKSILIENKIAFDRGHNLYELWNLIPKTFQEEIIQHIKTADPSYDFEKFEMDFTFFSNAFVDWRYAYEKYPVLHAEGFYGFIDAIVLTHLSHYRVHISPNGVTPPSEERKNAVENRKRSDYEELIAKNQKKAAKQKKK